MNRHTIFIVGLTAVLGWSAMFVFPTRQPSAQDAEAKGQVRKSPPIADEKSGSSHKTVLSQQTSAKLASDAREKISENSLEDGAENKEKDTAPREVSDEQMQNRRMSSAERAFQAETIDTMWASSARSDLTQGILSITTAGTTFSNVECRTTLCKFEFVSQDDEHARETLGKFLRENLWAGQGTASHARESDQTRVRVYVTKPGYQLPSPDSPDIE